MDRKKEIKRIEKTIENCVYKHGFNITRIAEIYIDEVSRKADAIIDKVLKLVKGLKIGFDDEMENVFEETLDKIKELRGEE